MRVVSNLADATDEVVVLVAAGPKVNILWIKVSNSGGTAVAGDIILEDASGNALFTYRAAVNQYAVTIVDWNDFFRFPDRGGKPGLESPSGLQIDHDGTVDNVLVEIGIE